MMVRTQISLDPLELRQAKSRAHDLGISLAEFVRQAVRKELGSGSTSGDISEIFGMAGAGGEPIAVEDYDDIIADAINEEYEEGLRTRHLLEP